MTTPSEKIAESLAELKRLQNDRGIAVFKPHQVKQAAFGFTAQLQFSLPYYRIGKCSGR
jgi:hypothetical protein